MTIKNLYKYENTDGSYSISPVRREEADEPYMFRAIADDGKVLTDGTNITPCIDTHTPEIYTEIDEPPEPPAPTPEEELQDAKNALNILGVK